MYTTTMIIAKIVLSILFYEDFFLQVKSKEAYRKWLAYNLSILFYEDFFLQEGRNPNQKESFPFPQLSILFYEDFFLQEESQIRSESP